MAPPGSDHYVKNAAAAPAESIEPWADALDELDPRELAMSRFRARNEVMAEIFGPERVRECYRSSGVKEGKLTGRGSTDQGCGRVGRLRAEWREPRGQGRESLAIAPCLLS